MNHLEFLSGVPLWIITLLFAATLLACMLVGRQLRRFVGVDPATAGNGQLLGGTFSLLSLMVGFTFGLALDRHDRRDDLLLEEANAILALQRVLVHVAEPGRSEVNNIIQDYAKGRLSFVEANLVAQTIQEAKRDRERGNLGEALMKMAPLPGSGVSSLQLMNASTRVLDAGSRQEHAMLEHVPARVVFVLYLLATGGAALVGISISANLHKLWLTAVIWSVLLSAAIFTIVDLDAPNWGSIRLDTTPLRSLITDRANPAK